MIPQQSRRAVQALTLLAVLALSGCAGPAHQDTETDAAASASAEPSGPVTEQVTSKVVAGVRVPVYPTDSYQPSPEDRRVIERAEYVLANRCMKKLGMSWPPPILSTWEAHAPSERRYGVSDRAAASQFGYQLPPPKGLSRSEQQRWNARQEARLASVERPVMDAYTGEGKGGVGCRGVARDELKMDWINSMGTTTAVSREGWEKSGADARVRALDSRWAACMRASGHAQSDPLAAAGRWAGSGVAEDGSSGVTPAPSAREIAMAVADVACKKKTDYVDSRQSVEIEYQTSAIGRNAEKLDAFRAAWTWTLDRARRVT